MAAGGALLATHRSLLDAERGDFAISEFGVKYLGQSKYRDEFFFAKTDCFPGLPEYPYFLYQRGVSIAAARDAEVLATYGHPYFDRSPEHYSSHVQTPCDRRTAEPFVVLRGRTAYVANPIFTSYAADGYGVYKQVIAELIRRLMPEPVLRAQNLPSTAQVTLGEQRDERRFVLHLLHYPCTRRAPNLDIIEEAGLLKNVRLQVRTPAPKRVRLVPAGAELPVRHESGYSVFTVPQVEGHQAIVIEV
jgi:hypothetical protein